jgi:hypothetical protein
MVPAWNQIAFPKEAQGIFRPSGGFSSKFPVECVWGKTSCMNGIVRFLPIPKSQLQFNFPKTRLCLYE